MAEQSTQPTEDPTIQRQEKARQEGQVAFSSEIVAAVLFFAAVLLLVNYGRAWLDDISHLLIRRLTFFQPMIESPDTILAALRSDVETVGWLLIPFLVALAIVAVLSGIAQTRFNISSKPLEFNLGKLSPIAGVKRMFSTRSLNRLGLSIFKTVAIVVTSVWIVMSYSEEINRSAMFSFRSILALGSEISIQIAITVSVFMLAFGGADLGFQIWKQFQELMMTKQEIKDEQKESEGDPMLKQRQRQIRAELSKRRAIEAVPSATVVITNPTHFAVALRYDSSESVAPIVVAKGADNLARKIIEVAKANGVAVVERKPVARFLYANVDVGKEIPFELYHAVAEILNFIRRWG